MCCVHNAVLRIEDDILAFFDRPDDKDFLLTGTLTTYHVRPLLICADPCQRSLRIACPAHVGCGQLLFCLCIRAAACNVEDVWPYLATCRTASLEQSNLRSTGKCAADTDMAFAHRDCWRIVWAIITAWRRASWRSTARRGACSSARGRTPASQRCAGMHALSTALPPVQGAYPAVGQLTRTSKISRRRASSSCDLMWVSMMVSPDGDACTGQLLPDSAKPRQTDAMSATHIMAELHVSPQTIQHTQQHPGRPARTRLAAASPKSVLRCRAEEAGGLPGHDAGGDGGGAGATGRAAAAAPPVGGPGQPPVQRRRRLQQRLRQRGQVPAHRPRPRRSSPWFLSLAAMAASLLSLIVCLFLVVAPSSMHAVAAAAQACQHSTSGRACDVHQPRVHSTRPLRDNPQCENVYPALCDNACYACYTSLVSRSATGRSRRGSRSTCARGRASWAATAAAPRKATASPCRRQARK